MMHFWSKYDHSEDLATDNLKIGIQCNFTRAKAIWQKATSLGSCRYLLSMSSHVMAAILSLIEPEICIRNECYNY